MAIFHAFWRLSNIPLYIWTLDCGHLDCVDSLVNPSITGGFVSFLCLNAFEVSQSEKDIIIWFHSYGEYKNNKNKENAISSENKKEIQSNSVIAESSSSSSVEETGDVPTDKIEPTKEEQVYLKQLSKINQLYQELNLPQYHQGYNQHHIEYHFSSEVRGFPVKTTAWHPETDIKICKRLS
ncbi:unnamed protein product [Nyctereutes procyonoides]|uniref:(raccoon dog) hypothetical protein n=1 Tax=Nyctereutes procyonoides TaxID=34880 RepID=A0A811XZC6_NYCPR|nr:unnamed protein product [Nyctereutes procyonoides]